MRLRTFSPTAHPLGRGAGLGRSSKWSCECDGATVPMPEVRGSEASRLPDDPCAGRLACPSSWGHQLLVWDPLDLTPHIFIWPVTCDPYVTFPNIPVDTGECVPEFCELFRQITAFKEGVVGISNL